MQKIRRATASARVAFALVATYGLLMQALAGAGTPMQALLAQAALTCAADGTGQDLPISPRSGHDCSCCILGCAPNGCGPLATAPVSLLYRFGETIVWTRAHRHDPTLPAVIHFAARGPPRA